MSDSPKIHHINCPKIPQSPNLVKLSEASCSTAHAAFGPRHQVCGMHMYCALALALAPAATLCQDRFPRCCVT